MKGKIEAGEWEFFSIFVAGVRYGRTEGFSEGFRQGFFAGAGVERSLAAKQRAIAANKVRGDWHQSALAWAVVRLAAEPAPLKKVIHSEIVTMTNNHRTGRRLITVAAVEKLLRQNKSWIGERVSGLKKRAISFPAQNYASTLRGRPTT